MKAVPWLLKRVKTARRIERGRDESFDGKLEKLAWELNRIKDLFMRVKEKEDELLDTLAEVDGHLHKLESKKWDQDIDGICKRIRECANKLLPKDDSSEEDHRNGQILHSSHPSSTQLNNKFLLDQEARNLIWKIYNEELDDQSKRCLSSLSVFPKYAVIKKRHAIYWWVGEYLVTETKWETAEEVGEAVINNLLKLNLIVPYGNGKCPIVNKFKIHPHIQSELVPSKLLPQDMLVLGQRKLVLGNTNKDLLKPHPEILTIFNVRASYLDFQSQWLVKRKDLQVLQLGRWQASPSHHIEVGGDQFLKELEDQRKLRYISLRGISRISKLPPSIVQLKSLEVLDLKACHNLETLPHDIGSLENLTHLIMSQCYMLEGMPKGIENLTELQVLKGFVISSSGRTPCSISDLANLRKLRRLSIHIRSEAVIKDREFKSLNNLSALEHLKISWGVSETWHRDVKIILPQSLKKLHLEGFPGQKIPRWLKPSRLLYSKIQQLKIIGGKLKNINHYEAKNLSPSQGWNMEVVHLKYLKHLKVDLTDLHELFPSLRYVEIKQTSNHSYIEWSNDSREIIVSLS
ncbi:hypothetical protein VNO78_15327 [Psophocarpus tetragonolobus]|uniref:Disease resistance RPP13-like protein 4 n=1 Tax=Psophocarpus tetragonolobus TaxID=3891 RepID=A0AAN9SDU7_PSOTE